MKINELATVTESIIHAICETITDDPHINRTIEHGLKKIPEELRVPVLDALEIIYMNQEPITVQDWADRLADLHQNLDLGSTLKTTVTEFPWLITRTAPRTYQWQENLDKKPENRSDHAGAIDLARTVLAGMKTLKTFTLDELAAWVKQQTGIPLQQITPYISHVISAFPDKIQKTQGGYTWTDNQTSGIDIIKNIVDRS